MRPVGPVAASTLGLVVSLAIACSGDDGRTSSGLQRVSIVTGDGRTVQLEVAIADDDAERARGLMGRRHLDPDEGLLLVFPPGRPAALWMKDTPLPLSAAFIAEDGRIVHIIDLEPFSLEIRFPASPARFALETRRGWFAANGVSAGDFLDLAALADVVGAQQ